MTTHLKKILTVLCFSMFLSALWRIPTDAVGQAPVPVWKAATKLAQVGIRQKAIVFKTQGQEARYKIFEISQPHKLVVEFYDAWLPNNFQRELNPSKEARALGVEKIRVAQFSGVPHHIARVVLDLAQPVRYNLNKQKDGSLNLELEDEKPKQEIKEEKKEPEEAAFRDILKELPKQPIDIDFQEVEMQSAIAIMISQLEELTDQKINLILAPDVAGTLTLQLQNVPFDEVFQLVLNSKGLIATQNGANILKVMGKATYQAERQQGALTTRIVPLNYANAADLLSTLTSIRTQEGSKANVLIAKEINSLIITDTDEGFLQLSKLIKELDVRPISVSIEAKIVDLKLDDSTDYGIEWQYAKSWNRSTANNVDNRSIGSVNPNDTTPIGGNSGVMPGGGVGEPVIAAPGLPAFITSAMSFGRVTNTSFLTMRIAAGMKEGKVKLLSNPRIVTLNNQAATITVGTQIPIPKTTISQTGTTQDISYTNTGIILNVTPTVNPDRYVRMIISPTVSRPGSIAAGGSAPPIDTRTASTVIITKDGETVVIGGLIDETKDKQVTKVPILGDIPILGWLFRRQSNATIRTELLVFVTPSVIE